MKRKCWKNNYKSKFVLRILVFTILLCFLCGCSDKSSQEGIVPQDAIVFNSEITDVYNNLNCIVTIISDDGDFNTVQNLNSLFGERNMNCTVAGVINNVSPHCDEWKDILKNGNIELVSHSYDHIRMEDGSDISKDMERLEHEIVDADLYLEENFGQKQFLFVCPENQMCINGYDILYKHDFWAVRRGNRGLNELSPQEGIQPGNWYNLMCYGIQDEGTTLEVRNNWVDQAEEEHKWLIEMWHNVASADDGGYQTTLLTDAEEHLDYIKEESEEGQIWVATFGEAVKYIREKQNYIPICYMLDDKVYVSLMKINYIDNEIFDQELTIKIYIPEDVKLDTSLDNVVDLEDGYILVNISPQEVLTIGAVEE